MITYDIEAVDSFALNIHTLLRFIDDIFMIWTHSKEDLVIFFDHLNNLLPSINFTMNFSRTVIDFLDVQIHNDPSSGVVTTDLYTKPTDTHQYLLNQQPSRTL